MAVTAGQVFELIGATAQSLKSRGILDANGNFAKQPALLEASEFAAVAGDVAAALQSKGVAVPDKIERIITALPGIASIASAIIG